LFRDGYLPLVEVSLGPGRPDTIGVRRLLSDHAGQMAPDDVLLVEVKQAMSGALTDKTFSDWVGQASEYARQVCDELSGADRIAYLLIIYGGSATYSPAPEILMGSTVVRPVFVDVGDKAASQRKSRPLASASRPVQEE